MNLAYTEEHKAFRAKVRSWLQQNVPDQPLTSFDTAEGFQQHRDWERTMNEGRWGMVTWPEELGGRAADLIQWIIFEEEYYRAGAPTRVNQMSILGAHAELVAHAPAAAGVGRWLDGFLFSQSGPIYAGTNEIQRNIIAERMLGMPRA